MAPEIGSFHEGKVTGITKFGAFVALPGGCSGLVHISEIANAYVSDISQFLQIGQDVRVKVIRITDDGKINLSIKQAQADGTQSYYSRTVTRECRGVTSPSQNKAPVETAGAHTARPAAAQISIPNEKPSPSPDQDFENRLKKFMKDSDSRIADNKYYQDRGRRSRKR